MRQGAAPAAAEERTLAAHVGKVLEEAREAKGLSRRAMAKQLGWSPPNLLRVESGEDNPTLDRLQRLATAYGGRLEVRFVEDEEA